MFVNDTIGARRVGARRDADPTMPCYPACLRRRRTASSSRHTRCWCRYIQCRWSDRRCRRLHPRRLHRRRSAAALTPSPAVPLFPDAATTMTLLAIAFATALPSTGSSSTPGEVAVDRPADAHADHVRTVAHRIVDRACDIGVGRAALGISLSPLHYRGHSCRRASGIAIKHQRHVAGVTDEAVIVLGVGFGDAGDIGSMAVTVSHEGAGALRRARLVGDEALGAHDARLGKLGMRHVFAGIDDGELDARRTQRTRVGDPLPLYPACE